VLTFTVNSEDRDGPRTVHIDPAAVATVEEAERRPTFGGWHQVAIVTLTTGHRHVVEDGARTVARQVAAAKAAAVSGGRG
jgi:hypothetical protein